MSAIPCRSFSDLQARRVSFSEWSGIQKSLVASRPSRIGWDLTKYAEFYQFADVPLSSIERQEARKIIEPFILLTERVNDQSSKTGVESLCLQKCGGEAMHQLVSNWAYCPILQSELGAQEFPPFSLPRRGIGAPLVERWTKRLGHLGFHGQGDQPSSRCFRQGEDVIL